MKYVLLAILLLPIEVNATDSLRAMMHARDAQQMQKSLTRTREIPRLRALCAAQLRKKYVPSACFEALALSDPAKNPESWLVDNCIHAVPALHDLQVLSRLLKAPAIPDVCRSEIQKQSDDLRYAAETESPATLFESEYVR